MLGLAICPKIRIAPVVDPKTAHTHLTAWNVSRTVTSIVRKCVSAKHLKKVPLREWIARERKEESKRRVEKGVDGWEGTKEGGILNLCYSVL